MRLGKHMVGLRRRDAEGEIRMLGMKESGVDRKEEGERGSFK